MSRYETILYTTDGPRATITLSRPEFLNTIVPPMPDEVEDAVALATRDSEINDIVVRGAGRAFCASYDFGAGFHHWDEAITTHGAWDPARTSRWRPPLHRGTLRWSCDARVRRLRWSAPLDGGSRKF
jgi:enoyl-CoA hydratase